MTPIFKVVCIDHVVLRVANLAASEAFYVGVLGCTKERELPDLGLYQYRAGEQLIDLVETGSKLGGDSPVVAGGNMDHLCLTIDPFDADKLQNYLARHDITTSPVGVRYGARGYGESVYINDPDGHTIELKGPE